MSYDVGFVDGNKERVYLSEPLDVRGGTYAVGGTSEAWLNITYNYGEHFRRMFEGGIRGLYGKTAAQVVEAIKAANVPSDVKETPCTCHGSVTCYWAVNAANVQAALDNLLILAEHVPPESIFEGD